MNLVLIVAFAAVGQFPLFQEKPRQIFPLFQTVRSEAPLRLLVFTSKWCGPCARMKPAVDALESEGVTVERIDWDTQRTVAESYEVASLPTVVVLRQGREVARNAGLLTLEALRRLVGIPAKQAKQPPVYPTPPAVTPNPRARTGPLGWRIRRGR